MLCNEAKNSELKNKKLAAVIISGGKIMDKPYCNTSQCTYKKVYYGSLHAEARAILNFFGKDLIYSKKKGWIVNTKRTKKLDLIVIRINNLNQICNSRPCINCLNMMKAVGIRKVYYSVLNDIICENVKDMFSIQKSFVTKKLEKITKNINDDELSNEMELIKYFPSTIKKNSLEYFVNYSLFEIFPNYKIKIIKNSVSIYNSNNKKIIESSII
jgi:deoxycytidylate deaminase